MTASRHSSIKRSLTTAILLGSLYAVSAGATTIDFGSLPQESVNGVTVDGVTFGYTEFGSVSPEALFDVDLGPGVTQNVQTPALVGFTDGVLTLSFAQAIQQLSFGVAETTNLSLTPGFSVSLFDGSTLLGSTGVETDPLVLFSEGEFSYVGQPVTSIAISFDSVDANEFALGSVNFTVPEPASSTVFAAGLMLLGAMVVRRRQA
jgi:hypothetical protein